MIANKETIMNSISNLGFQVFRNGQFHWNSSKTPDMLINEDGSIHCWTSSPFKNNTKNHGDLIDFLQMININQSFKEAKQEAERLTGLKLPSLDSYKDNGYTIDNTNKKTGYIDEKFIKIFDIARKENFSRYKELLNQALPSLDFEKQKELALKYQIGYIELSDRLSMPIRDEKNRIVTLWKYNKNPKSYINENGEEVIPSKVLFTKARDRSPFNLYDLKEYRKDLSEYIFLCGGEKDALNMIGNGFKAITLGSENESLKDTYKPFFQDLRIVIAYDNDMAGEKGTIKIFEQLKEVAKEVKIFDWKEVEKQGIKLNEGFDMTDYLVQIKKLNLEFNKKYRDEIFINEIKSKYELKENKQNTTYKKKDIKMALLELTGQNQALTIVSDNKLSYKDNEGAYKPRGNLATTLNMLKDAVNVVSMNVGSVTFSANVTNNQGEKEYHKFFVNLSSNGDIILKPVQYPNEENLYITFNKINQENGRYTFQLDDTNMASNFIKAFNVSTAQNGARYLGANLYLKNDTMREALKNVDDGYKIVLSKDSWELKSNDEIFKKEVKANEDLENIKKVVAAYGNYGNNTQANKEVDEKIEQQSPKPQYNNNRNQNRA